jgi:predicted dehydrogenase
MDPKTDRRQFLQRSVQGGLGATLAMSSLASPRKAAAASDKVRLGFIGLGGRGTFVLNLFLQRPDVEVAYVCDVFGEHRARASKAVESATGRKPKSVDDLRRVLDDPQVDAVYVATPDHWHALATIMACQASKDVYVEKPASQSIWEGRKMVEAARRYNRVVQVGMQNRSSTYAASARARIQSGKLGDIHLVRVNCMIERTRLDEIPDTPTPEGMNWDLWLGPAPKRPYNSKWYKNWLYFWDFSSGLKADTVHQLDLMRAVLGLSYPSSVHSAGGNLAFHDAVEVPDTTVATYKYDNLTMAMEEAWWTPYLKKTPEPVRQSETVFPDWYPFNGTKVEIYGTKGMMLLGRHGGGWQIYDQDGQKVDQDKETHAKVQAAHVGNFVDCIRSRKRPNADIEEGHISATLCHMTNISTRLGNRVLNFDATTESFINDQEANRYLKRSYREPWVVPQNL